MAADDLFGELPNQAKPPADAAPLGAPRLREPQRDQIALRAMDIESLIGEDHPARLIWSYVGELDLSELENRIKAEVTAPVTPRHRPDFCWRCGSTRPARGSAARGRWRGCAKAMMPTAGCWAGCR